MTNDEGFEYTSPMHAAAIGMHEMYVTLKSAGFSRTESLELIARMLSYGANETAMLEYEFGADDDDDDDA
jgi:hypothetical protein